MAGTYDDPAQDAALSVFIDAIAKGDRRVAHVVFDVSGIAGYGKWMETTDLIASRLRAIAVISCCTAEASVPGGASARTTRYIKDEGNWRYDTSINGLDCSVRRNSLMSDARPTTVTHRPGMSTYPWHVGANQARPHALADRALARPQATRHRYVHDGGTWRIVGIRFVEIASIQQRLSEHCQVARRDHVVADEEVVAGRLRRVTVGIGLSTRVERDQPPAPPGMVSGCSRASCSVTLSSSACACAIGRFGASLAKTMTEWFERFCSASSSASGIHN